MNPVRERKATIVDLLDRILDHGIVLNADIIITVADVPLIAISLQAHLASVETMKKHGLMLSMIHSCEQISRQHNSIESSAQ